MEPDAAPAQAGARRARQSGDQSAPGRSRGPISRRPRRGMAGSLSGKSENSRAGSEPMNDDESVNGDARGGNVGNSLLSLAADLASGAVRVIDLTQTLSSEFPRIALPP